MTRPKKSDSHEKEVRIQKTIQEFQEGDISLTEVAWKHGVGHQTVKDRLDGKLPRYLAQEKTMHLRNAEQKELIQWMTSLTATGYASCHAILREMAEYLHFQCISNDISISIEFDPLQCIGNSWIPRFLNRYPELTSVHIRSIEAARVKDTSVKRLTHWFEDLNDAIIEYNILPENMYNMDESSFAIGEIEASK